MAGEGEVIFERVRAVGAVEVTAFGAASGIEASKSAYTSVGCGAE